MLMLILIVASGAPICSGEVVEKSARLTLFLSDELDIGDALGDLAQVFSVGPDVRSQGDARVRPIPIRGNGYRKWHGTILARRNRQIQNLRRSLPARRQNHRGFQMHRVRTVVTNPQLKVRTRASLGLELIRIKSDPTGVQAKIAVRISNGSEEVLLLAFQAILQEIGRAHV